MITIPEKSVDTFSASFCAPGREYFDFSINHDGCDITIVCKDESNEETLYFNSYVLNNLSDYFKALLSKNFREGNSKKITLYKPKELMNNVLNYADKRRIEINEETIQPLLEVSCEFLITDLKEAIENVLISGINNIDPVLLINIGCEYELENLRIAFRKLCKTRTNNIIGKIKNSKRFGEIDINFNKMVSTWVDEISIYNQLKTINPESLRSVDFESRLKVYIENFEGGNFVDDENEEAQWLDFYMDELLKFLGNKKYSRIFEKFIYERYMKYATEKKEHSYLNSAPDSED